MLIIVKLTSMNEASRKNMMSISGMISIRARLICTGELLWLMRILIGGDSVSVAQRVQHQNDVVRGRFELELESRNSGIEEIKEYQSENRDSKTAGSCDQCFGDSAADLGRRQIGSPDKVKGAHDPGDSTQQPEEG